MMANRQSFQFEYHGTKFTGFGVPVYAQDPNFAHFVDCLHGRDEMFVWCEYMKVRIDSLIQQAELFAPSESDIAEVAWYGDAEEG